MSFHLHFYYFTVNVRKAFKSNPQWNDSYKTNSVKINITVYYSYQGVESEGSEVEDVGELKFFTIPQDYKSRSVNKINSVLSAGILMTGESK